MQYYKCECGKTEAKQGMGVYPCSKCRHCGSNLTQSTRLHKAAKPHEMIKTPVQTDDGESYISRCKWCLRTKKQLEELGESYQEELPME